MFDKVAICGEIINNLRNESAPVDGVCRGQEKARTRKNVPETEIGDTVLKERIPAADIDDFDYDKYLADIDKKTSSDDEVDKILEDWHS